MAISAEIPSPSSPKSMTEACTGSLEEFRYRTKSEIPPLYRYVTTRGPAVSVPGSAVPASGRSSVSVIVRPRLRKAISWSRRDSVSKFQVVVSKIVASGQNVVIVPVSADSSPRSSGPIGAPRS